MIYHTFYIRFYFCTHLQWIFNFNTNIKSNTFHTFFEHIVSVITISLSKRSNFIEIYICIYTNYLSNIQLKFATDL